MSIALEMKVRSQTQIMKAKPLVVEGVTVADPSTSAPYAALSQVQPTIVQPIQKDKDEEEVSITITIITPSTRRSARLTKVNQEQVDSPKKKTEQMFIGPRNRRKT